MFCALTSSASALVNVARKALVPEYVANMGEGTAPANEPMFKISPRFLQEFKLETISRRLRFMFYF